MSGGCRSRPVPRVCACAARCSGEVMQLVVRRVLQRAFISVLVAAVLAACGSASADRTASPGSTTSVAGVAPGTVLHVGDQGQFLQTLLHTAGYLDSVPYKVEFAQFASGPLVNAAFAAH